MVPATIDKYKCYLKDLFYFYPGQFDNWGIFSKKLGDYSKDSIIQFIDKLNEYDAVFSNDYYLNAQIKIRLFELKNKEDWIRNPIFYVDKGIESITDLINYPNLLYRSHAAIIKSRVLDCQKIFQQAITNLDKNRLTVEECQIALLRVSRGLKELKAYNPDCSKLLEKSAKEYMRFLMGVIQKGKNKFTIDEGLLEEELKIWNINLDLHDLYRKIKDSFAIDIYFKSNNEKINLGLKEIYILGKNKFRVDSSLFDDLIICEKKDLSDIGCLYPKVNKNEKSVYMYNPELNKSLEKKILNIIHEIYPGHHYYTVQKIKKRQNLYKNYDNLFFEEGWAKFCEFYYSFYIFNNDVLKNTFYKKLRKNLFSFLLVYEIAFKKRSIEQILNDDFYLKYLTEKQVRIIYYSVCENYISSISYFLGFFEIYSSFLKDGDINKLIEKYILLERE